MQDAPDWQEILTYFRGSELQNYFTRILEDDLHAIIKPQYVDHIPRAVKGNVEDVLIQKDGRGQREHLQKVLELEQVLDRDVEHLSGLSYSLATQDDLLHWDAILLLLQQACLNTLQLFTLRKYACRGHDCRALCHGSCTCCAGKIQDGHSSP